LNLGWHKHRSTMDTHEASGVFFCPVVPEVAYPCQQQNVFDMILALSYGCTIEQPEVIHMSNTKRMTVNVPVELYDRCNAAIDGVYVLNMSQLVLVAMSDFVGGRVSPPLPPSPLHPPTPNTPPIISPKGDIYTPPKSPPEKPKKTAGRKERYSDDFESFWSLYPSGRSNKRPSYKSYQAAIKVASHADIMSGLEMDMVAEEWATKPKEFVPHATTWLNQRRWEKYDKANKKEKPVIDGVKVAIEVKDYSELLSGESCEHWESIVDDLRDAIGGYEYMEWFAKTRAIIVKDTLVIGCPDQSHADWIMQCYRTQLFETVGMRFVVVDGEEFEHYLGIS